MRKKKNVYYVNYPLTRQASHPGEIVADFLQDDPRSTYELAGLLGFTYEELGLFTRGQLNVTAEIAHKLSETFGATPEFWLKLQDNFDIGIPASQISNIP